MPVNLASDRGHRSVWPLALTGRLATDDNIVLRSVLGSTTLYNYTKIIPTIFTLQIGSESENGLKLEGPKYLLK